MRTLTDTLEELRQEIQEGFDEVADDVGLFHDKLWPAVVKLEKFFRKTNQIEALEDQVQLLDMMGDPIYRSIYQNDEYVVCRRILDIDPTREAAKHQIEDHIIADRARLQDEKKLRTYLEEYYQKNKSEGYSYFLG